MLVMRFGQLEHVGLITFLCVSVNATDPITGSRSNPALFLRSADCQSAGSRLATGGAADCQSALHSSYCRGIRAMSLGEVTDLARGLRRFWTAGAATCTLIEPEEF